MRKTLFVAVVVCLAWGLPALAGAGPEMQKLDFMLGEWKGEGSMQRGPGKPDASFVHETIRSVAGGNALAIEGVGRRRLEDGSSGEVVHDAFGVIWWDAVEKKYRFSAFTAASGHADAHFDLVGDKTAVWGFQTPQGHIRYTIRMTEDGQWREVGEFSRDGAQWMTFFEMTLRKVK